MLTLNSNKNFMSVWILLSLVMVGCGQKSTLSTYYYGTTSNGESAGNVDTLFWQTVQNGNGIEIKLACTNQSLYSGTFTSGSTISLAPAGQSIISAIATVDGTNLLLKNSSDGSVIQVMKAVRDIDCGSTQGANAVPGGIPLQFMYAALDAPGVSGENAVDVDCSPDYVAAQEAAGNTVSSGCKHISLVYDIETLPVTTNYTQGTNVKSKSTACDISGIACVSSDVTVKQMKKLASVAALSTGGQIWPGNLLQGGKLASGNGLVPITIGPRAAAQFTISKVVFPAGSTYDFTLPNGWTYADFQNAINQKMNSTEIVGQTANFEYATQNVYSSTQLDFALNVDGTIDDVKLGAKLNLNTDNNKNHVLLMLRQTFYTVDFADPTSGMVSVFADGVNVQDPKGQIGASNPPGYIKSVDYGKQIYFLITSQSDSFLIDATLTAAVNGTEDGPIDEKTSPLAASLHLKYSDVLKDSTINYAVIGGGIEDAIAVLGGGSAAEGSIPQDLGVVTIYNRLRKFISNVKAAKYSPSNPGAPVAFTANMLKTNANIVMAYTADFTQKDCVKYAATPAIFDMRLSNFNNQICLYPNGRAWTDGASCFTGTSSEIVIPLTQSKENGKQDEKEQFWTSGDTEDQRLQLVQWINDSRLVPTANIAIWNSNLPVAQFAANLDFKGTAYGGYGHDLVIDWTLNQNTCDKQQGVIGTVGLKSYDSQPNALQVCSKTSDSTCF